MCQIVMLRTISMLENERRVVKRLSCIHLPSTQIVQYFVPALSIFSGNLAPINVLRLPSRLVSSKQNVEAYRDRWNFMLIKRNWYKRRITFLVVKSVHSLP